MSNVKYYIVGVAHEGVENTRTPDIDIGGWTAIYPTSDVAIVRDPYGRKDYPILGIDVAYSDALADVYAYLPMQFDKTITQEEVDSLNNTLGWDQVSLQDLSSHRVGGK